jgi:hypothetical protein
MNIINAMEEGSKFCQGGLVYFLGYSFKRELEVIWKSLALC